MKPYTGGLGWCHIHCQSYPLAGSTAELASSSHAAENNNTATA